MLKVRAILAALACPLMWRTHLCTMPKECRYFMPEAISIRLSKIVPCSHTSCSAVSFVHTASILFPRLPVGSHQAAHGRCTCSVRRAFACPLQRMGPDDRSWTGYLQDARHGCTSLCVRQAERLTIVRLKRLLLMA